MGRGAKIQLDRQGERKLLVSVKAIIRLFQDTFPHIHTIYRSLPSFLMMLIVSHRIGPIQILTDLLTGLASVSLDKD